MEGFEWGATAPPLRSPLSTGMLIHSSSLSLLFPFLYFPFLPRLEHVWYLVTRVPESPADLGSQTRRGTTSFNPGLVPGSAGCPPLGGRERGRGERGRLG